MITTQRLFTFLTTSYLFLLSLHFADAKKCSPSACGPIRNISFPFHLKSHCGDPKFKLTCENNVTFLYHNSIKYYVKAINYKNNTIRLADASINNNDICSFPIASSYAYNFTSSLPYYVSSSQVEELSVNLISCPNPLNTNTSLFTDITQHCASNLSHPGFSYVYVGRIHASELPHMCTLHLIMMTAWPGFIDVKNVSLSQIHQSLLYGFELQFCYNCNGQFTDKLFNRISVGPAPYLLIPLAILDHYYQLLEVFSQNFFSVLDLDLPAVISGIIICAPRIIIGPLLFWFLIYKFQRRRLSSFESVESFLQSDNKLAPIRYSYSDLKKMTKNFEDKLGQGGFGSVYKGKLRSGHLVAIKLLGKSGANGQDFINEIATIGRIHHANVVQLVGYCAERSKRALIFDFMPNGSLDKYIFNRGKTSSLDWDLKFKIAVEVGRWIEYLHHGCDIQILHFDIKPHNILLDDKFVPKVSDFGMAKLCATNKEAVTLTTARGTIRYVAPELINRSIGVVSYKADVYSFGMLLMEMVSLNKNLTRNNDESSKYFPNWIYDHLNQGRDIGIGNVDENGDSNIVRKITIVALWCIQMSPDNRPAMNKVLQMLEGDVENLRIPSYPTYMTESEEERWAIDSNASTSLLHDNNESNIIEIISYA